MERPPKLGYAPPENDPATRVSLWEWIIAVALATFYGAGAVLCLVAILNDFIHQRLRDLAWDDLAFAALMLVLGSLFVRQAVFAFKYVAGAEDVDAK